MELAVRNSKADDSESFLIVIKYLLVTKILSTCPAGIIEVRLVITIDVV